MRGELLERLGETTAEEKAILAGNSAIDRAYYGWGRDSVVDINRLIPSDKLLGVRTHTRFVDFPEHSHNYVELMYVCRGSVTHDIEGTTVRLEGGDLLFISPNTRHSVQKAGHKDVSVNFIIRASFFDIPMQMLPQKSILAKFLVDTIRHDSKKGPYLHFRLKNIVAVDHLMDNIISSVTENRTGEEEINKFSMGLVFLYAMRHIERLSSQSTYNYRSALMKMTLQYIEDRYKDANLFELAAELHQSLSVLSRTIRHETGYTFQELLQRKRFKKAVTLLADTDLSVADIMNACGYANSSYFYRKFREKYRCTPKEYRQRK